MPAPPGRDRHNRALHLRRNPGESFYLELRARLFYCSSGSHDAIAVGVAPVKHPHLPWRTAAPRSGKFFADDHPPGTA